MDESATILAAGAKELGIMLDANALSRFKTYAELLQLWNEKVNLTAITSPRHVAEKHFLDSLSVLTACPKAPFGLMDVGSGAGFPGVPIAIAEAACRVTLMEATAKKGAFLKELVARLGLTNVEICIGRAEILAHDPGYREKFDVATARAVAHLATLVEFTLPFVRVGGVVIAQKALGSESTESAAGAIECLGGSYEKEIPIRLPALSDRRLILVRKIKATPATYPRRVGLPAKRPLTG